MKVNPYLNFDGQAEEAFTFYQSIFGGELTKRKMMEAPNRDQLSEDEQHRMMHIALPIGPNAILMASDILPSAGQQLHKGNSGYISLHPHSKEETDRLFQRLSAGGDVEMPPEDQSWGDYFGCFTDKFGLQWMVNFS